MAFDFKSASLSEKKAEFDRIAKVIGDDQFFTKKELNHLPEILANGEEVIAFSSGIMDGNTWLITLTDRRVIFLDKGLLYGLKQVSIDMDKISSVTGETGLIFGKIKIKDGIADRVIDNVWKKTVVPFTNLLRDAIERRKASSAQSSIPEDDIISKLERLAALRDRGILSDAEFDAQKQKILAT